ncbi:MAG: DNA replication and repair protein RecF [Armatimonadota bacterium]|nr:DNA replication and repair protein RecF [Armatimonadota bacterium]
MSRLRRLSLRAFRNYARADVEFGDGITLLVGRNGQGKSNVLEAVYLVATGRSYRTAHEGEVIRYGETLARVRARVLRRDRDEELEIAVVREGERVVSRMRVNGVETPRGSVLGRLPVVLAAPWDLEVIRGGGAGRRRVLDAALAQISPAYFYSLQRYHRVVTQRNAELRRKARAHLEPWDAQLVALGVRLTAHRAEYVARLRGETEAWFARLGGEGALGVAYRPSWTGAGDAQLSQAAALHMARVRADEYRRGVTLSGPHRDDLDLTLGGVPLRAGGSQGQWRTAMLALRMAERAVMAEELGTAPVLLLDDALAELDPERQCRVLGLGDEAQVLVTATARPEIDRPVRCLRIEAGTVTEDAWSRRSETS